MSENYKDILSHLSTDVDQGLLLQYLQGKLPDDQKHELEKQLAQSDFEADAIEGLEEFTDKAQLEYMVEMLNRDLKAKTKKKKNRRQKLEIKFQPSTYIAILILLLLVALCYMVIRRLSNS